MNSTDRSYLSPNMKHNFTYSRPSPEVDSPPKEGNYAGRWDTMKLLAPTAEEWAMNIVLLTNIMTPYRQFFYDELHARLIEHGHDFHVILMAKTEPSRHWNYEDYQTEYSILLDHITIKKPFPLHLNWGLKRILQSLRPDIVICGGSYLLPSVWQTLRLRRKLGFTAWYWSESHLSEQRNYKAMTIRIREFIRKRVIGRFDGFWYAGTLSQEFLKCYTPEQAKFIFVPNLIDANKFERVNSVSSSEKRIIRQRYGIDEAERVFLTPARLSREKGLLEFLDLYRSAVNKQNITYLLAGDGELREEIEQFCQNNNLNVRLLGYKEEDDMLELYAIADVFILPSLGDPNPLTCIEACYSSLPLFISRHIGSYPEVIKNETNGYVFSYDDRADATEKLNSLIHAPNDWLIAAGSASHTIAETVFNPRLQIERIVQELENLPS